MPKVTYLLVLLSTLTAFAQDKVLTFPEKNASPFNFTDLGENGIILRTAAQPGSKNSPQRLGHYSKSLERLWEVEVPPGQRIEMAHFSKVTVACPDASIVYYIEHQGMNISFQTKSTLLHQIQKGGILKTHELKGHDNSFEKDPKAIFCDNPLPVLPFFKA